MIFGRFWKGMAAVAVLLALVALTACANYSTAPGGGPKDVLPPVMLASEPAQGTTGFQGGRVTMLFDEFVELQETDRIYASPVLKEANYSYYLKKVMVDIADTLRPDCTYTLRFGNSLVDLHEANPILDFHYVFSTGQTIDSMFLEGRVLKAVDYQPEDRVRLLFFAHRPDTFPFDDEPDYVSIGDPEGYFRVLHMKEGCYFVYAVIDEDQNYRINPVTEMMAYTDTCVTALKMVPLPAVDSVAWVDSLAETAVAETDVSAVVSDSLVMGGDTLMAVQDSVVRDTSVEKDPVLALYLYRDCLPAYFLKGMTFKKRGQLDLSFYYPIDSIEDVVFIAQVDTVSELRSPRLVWQWASDRRSASVQFNDYGFIDGEVVWQVGGYRDTVSAYLPEAARRADTLAFQLAASGGTVMLGDTLKWQGSLPLDRLDTARMTLWRMVSREQAVHDTVWAQPDSAVAGPPDVPADMPGDSLMIPADAVVLLDSVATADAVVLPDSVAIVWDSVDGRWFRLRDTVAVVTDTLQWPFTLLPLDEWTYGLVTETDTNATYALFLRDSAVYDFLGRPNDTAVCTWQISGPTEQPVGDLALELYGLEAEAVYVLQLVEGSDNIVRTVRVVDTGMVEFPDLRPAVYTFRLLKDDNDNGYWDEGDYVRRIQPEQHWYYHKTLRVEADWRIEDIWRIE